MIAFQIAALLLFHVGPEEEPRHDVDFQIDWVGPACTIDSSIRVTYMNSGASPILVPISYDLNYLQPVILTMRMGPDVSNNLVSSVNMSFGIPPEYYMNEANFVRLEPGQSWGFSFVPYDSQLMDHVSLAYAQVVTEGGALRVSYMLFRDFLPARASPQIWATGADSPIPTSNVLYCSP